MQVSRLLALLLVSAITVGAQPEGPLKSVALTFGFNGLNLSSPEGGDVGGKYWLPGNRALVLGLLGRASRNRYDNSDSTLQDGESSTYHVGILAGLEQHADLGGRLSPYVTGVSSARFSISRYYATSPNGTSATRGRTLFLEFSGGAGLEWWFTRRLSLTGQQLLNAKYHIGKEQYDGDREQKFHGFSLGLGTSSLMLNVYL
jgi:hypothetical protein